MKNNQGDIRGYRPQPTAPIPVVHPNTPQSGYQTTGQQQPVYPNGTQPAAPQQPMTGPYHQPQQGYPQNMQQPTGSYQPQQGYPQNMQQPAGSYPPQQGYPQNMQQPAGPYQPQQAYPQNMQQPTGPYQPQQGYPQNMQQPTGSYVPPQNPQPYPPQASGSYQPLPDQASPLDKLRVIASQLDMELVMLLAAAVLGLAYALFVTISFSWLTRLIPHFVVVWLTVAVNAAACILRQKRLNLAAAAGYVLSLLLFLNYFYLLLVQIVLCVLAYLRKDE